MNYCKTADTQQLIHDFIYNHEPTTVHRLKKRKRIHSQKGIGDVIAERCLGI